jgi:hypothetical protein
MRKILFPVLIFAIILGMSNCDNEDNEDNEEVPKNIFAGREWEYIIDNDGGAGNIDHKKISFSDNEFIFYHRKDRTNKEDTITGTYKLFYEEFPQPPFDPRLEERIKFISDEPTFNGTASYWLATPDSPISGHIDDTIIFHSIAGDCTILNSIYFLPVKN